MEYFVLLGDGIHELSKHITLQTLTPEDYTRLEKLHRLCFPDDPWDSKVFAALFKYSGAMGCKAVVMAPAAPSSNAQDGGAPGESGQTAGFLLWRWIADESEILTFGVVPEFRNKGIGYKMLTHFFALARHNAINRIILEVAEDNIPAFQLYQQLGFTIVGQRKNYYARQNGYINAQVMSLQLGP